MKRFSLLASCLLLLLSGCGYTSKTQLPDHIQTVHVEKIPNRIDISEDVSNQKSFKTYRPGLEVELRNSLIDRFVFDGHLRIAEKEKADAFLKSELLDFRRDPLRYNSDESVQEFRVNVVASFKFVDARTGSVIWETGEMAGNSTYFIAGQLAVSEDEAVELALEDLSRHVVEAVLEVW